MDLPLRDEDDTSRFGARLAAVLKVGDVVILEGDLGAGKTTLVRHTARALGVPEAIPVTSPTFSLVHELEGRVPIIHADLYRLSDAGEVLELGLDEHLGRDAIAFIEWGSAFVEVLGRADLRLTLEFGSEGGGDRRVKAEALSEVGERRLAAGGGLW